MADPSRRVAYPLRLLPRMGPPFPLSSPRFLRPRVLLLFPLPSVVRPNCPLHETLNFHHSTLNSLFPGPPHHPASGSQTETARCQSDVAQNRCPHPPAQCPLRTVPSSIKTMPPAPSNERSLCTHRALQSTQSSGTRPASATGLPRSS